MGDFDGMCKQAIFYFQFIKLLLFLSGLCRTCEIFGVSEYVMGNMKFLNDRNFETLSVTAQKWLPITEVRVAQLSKVFDKS